MGKKVLMTDESITRFGAADIRWAFTDHATILGLVFNAVLNVRFVRDGSVLRHDKIYLRGNPAFGSERSQELAKQIADCVADSR